MFTIFLLIISIILIILSGASEAVMDKVQFHYDKSIFWNDDKYKQTFWDPDRSWVNKYKPGSTSKPKFWGSTTFFVFTTDAWHLFKFFKNTSIFISMGISMYASTFISQEFDFSNILFILLFIVIGRSFYGLSFNLFFDKFLKL
tara:strand:- start:13 stop:444 length:432 start_codon:yes stop_codon:yes gene_type:complete